MIQSTNSGRWLAGIAWRRTSASGATDAGAAYERGVLVEDGVWHWARPGGAPPSIMLGYGGVSEAAIRRGIVILADTMVAVRGSG